MKNHLLNLKSLISLSLISAVISTCIAQEGFYVGAGWNTYFAKEQVVSQDKTVKITHATQSKNNGFLTQSLGHYGMGIHTGFRKDINNKRQKNIITLDAQYYFNHQNVKLESNMLNRVIKTKANFNHGFRLALGHRFKKVHPYLIIQGFYQNISPQSTLVNNNGIIYDVDDNGGILKEKLDTNGGSFTTDVYSLLGGFGFEILLDKSFTLNIEYVPMKHVEYGMKDVNDSDQAYSHGLSINQLQVGIRYYFFNPFKKNMKG